MASMFPRIISADSHVIEPRDLWWKALGKKFGDRTPRVIGACPINPLPAGLAKQ